MVVGVLAQFVELRIGAMPSQGAQWSGLVVRFFSLNCLRDKQVMPPLNGTFD